MHNCIHWSVNSWCKSKIKVWHYLAILWHLLIIFILYSLEHWYCLLLPLAPYSLLSHLPSANDLASKCTEKRSSEVPIIKSHSLLITLSILHFLLLSADEVSLFPSKAASTCLPTSSLSIHLHLLSSIMVYICWTDIIVYYE